MHRTALKAVRYYLASSLAVISILLGACTQPAKEYHYSIFTFGTLIDITLYNVSEKKAEAAFNLLQQNFDQYHQDWSPWTNGDLAQLNKKLATDEAIDLPDHLVPLIKTSMQLSELTSNFYNPTIGNLINLWQFHRYQEKNIKPPDSELIQQLVKKNPKMADLQFDQQNRLISKNPAVSLNFGAFAKGYAIRLSIEQLKKLGIENAVINAGGDLSVIGQHGDRAWNIGIRHPRNDSVLASVAVKDNESVFTSGDYERFYFYQDTRYHHILDPRSGYPTQDAQSVTIIHQDAGFADAAATAIFVAGSKDWQSIAKKMGLRYVMLIDADGDIHLTPAMEKRIKFLNKSPGSRIFVSNEL